MAFFKLQLTGAQQLLVLISRIMSLYSFFDTPNGNIYIHDVINGDVEYLEALLDLYREFFPQYLSALPDIRERAFLPANVDARFIRHQWVIVFNGLPVALVSFRYAIRQRLGLCFSIAIRPDYRSLAWDGYRRLSDFLFQQVVKQLEVDIATSGDSTLLGLVVEVEMVSSQKPYLHLFARYEEYGFLPLPIAYYEPAFVRGNADDPSLLGALQGAQPMQLYMLPTCSEMQVYLQRIRLLNSVVDALLLDHYGLAENHEIVKQARKSIENLGEANEGRN